MGPSDYEAIGRGVTRLFIAAVLIVGVAGSLWVLNDLRLTVDRGEINDAAGWAIVSFAGVCAVAIGGSSAFGLWRLMTGRFRGL